MLLKKLQLKKIFAQHSLYFQFCISKYFSGTKTYFNLSMHYTYILSLVRKLKKMPLTYYEHDKILLLLLNFTLTCYVPLN